MTRKLVDMPIRTVAVGIEPLFRELATELRGLER